MYDNDKRAARRWAVLATGLAACGGIGFIGLAGPAQAAVPGLVQVQASSPFTSADKSVTVTCPAGRVVLSPGGYLTGANGSVTMDQIQPNAALTLVTVRGAETDPFGGAWSVTAVAKCAIAPPGLTRIAVTTLSTSVDKSVTATCPAGRFLTGAGGQFTNGSGEVIMTALTPNAALNTVTVTGDEDAVYTPTWSATAYAICATRCQAWYGSRRPARPTRPQPRQRSPSARPVRFRSAAALPSGVAARWSWTTSRPRRPA